MQVNQIQLGLRHILTYTLKSTVSACYPDIVRSSSHIDLHLEKYSECRLRTKLGKRVDFNFTGVSFAFICIDIPWEPEYEVYISQWIRYSRKCGSYHDFSARGLQLTRKLHIRGFIGVKLKSSFRKVCCCHHNVINRHGISVSQMTRDVLYLSYSQSHLFSIHDLPSCLLQRVLLFDAVIS